FLDFLAHAGCRDLVVLAPDVASRIIRGEQHAVLADAALLDLGQQRVGTEADRQGRVGHWRSTRQVPGSSLAPETRCTSSAISRITGSTRPPSTPVRSGSLFATASRPHVRLVERDVHAPLVTSRRGAKERRSDAAIATSLMLASRRFIRPSELNSHSSLP